MGRRGTKTKPDEIHKLAGTFRPDRHKTADVASGKANLECPDWIKGEAREMWKRITPLLITAHLVEELDVDMIVSLCWWWERWRNRCRAVQAAERRGDEDSMDRLHRQARNADSQWRAAAIKLTAQSFI